MGLLGVPATFFVWGPVVVLCVGGGAPPKWVPPPQDAQSATRTRTAAALSNRLERSVRFNLYKISIASNHVTNIGNVCRDRGGGAKRNLPIERVPARAVVVTETVEVATFEPSMGEDAGETSHVECIGAPVHVQVIA